MKEKFHKEEMDKNINVPTEKIKKDKDKELFNMQRKASLTWNIIFFIGILTTSIAVSLFSKSDSFSIMDFFSKDTNEKGSLWASIFGLLVSFVVGILASYFKTKQIANRYKFEVEEFLKESYLTKLDDSKLNPKRV